MGTWVRAKLGKNRMGGRHFMIGPDELDIIPEIKDSGLWFNVESPDEIIGVLKSKDMEMDIEPDTFYGRKVVNFKDRNGFRVSFSFMLNKASVSD